MNDVARGKGRERGTCDRQVLLYFNVITRKKDIIWALYNYCVPIQYVIKAVCKLITIRNLLRYSHQKI